MSDEAFALLGLGASGRAFRDKHFELPGGRIGWIRWIDQAWLDGDGRPTVSFEVPPDEPLDPFAGELTDEWLDHSSEAGRFVIHVENAGPWASAQDMAGAAADVAAGLLAFAAPLSEEFGAVRLEPDWVNQGFVVLQEIERRDAAGWAPPWLGSALREHVALPHTRTTEVMNYVGPAMDDGEPTRWGVVPALIYHQLAMQEFAFAPDDVREVIANPDAGPDRPYERARAEASFHNTWKSIEAALGGELSSDEVRLGRRMCERGLDGNALPRFPDNAERTLRDRLRRLQGVRNRQSAHGGRTGVPRRVVTYFDLVEAQWMAAEVVFGILQAAMVSPSD